MYEVLHKLYKIYVWETFINQFNMHSLIQAFKINVIICIHRELKRFYRSSSRVAAVYLSIHLRNLFIFPTGFFPLDLLSMHTVEIRVAESEGVRGFWVESDS